jgi:cellulose synthase (UDP-forming)
LPTHWLSQSCTMVLTVLAPLVFLLTGLQPFANVTTASVLFYIVPMILALIGGLQVFARQEYFPLASRVLSTFQSFKILPTVVRTLVSPFAHTFKVTPKGRDAKTSNYQREIFWISAGLMFMTAGGLVVNSIPEWHVIAQTSLLPVMAIWGAINIVILFLVCMLSLQAQARRSEERFLLDEPAWIFSASGALSTGRIRDISLSGIAVEVDQNRAMVTATGSFVRVFIPEVGFVNAQVVRRADRFLALKFDLPHSVERDLLISKLFTLGHNTVDHVVETRSATITMLASVFRVRSERIPPQEGEALASQPAAKLAARSLVVPPSQTRGRLVDLGAQRRTLAA